MLVPTDVGPLWLPADDEVITPWLAEYGTWEVAEGSEIRRLLQPGMTFVDIGANVGYFTLLASDAVGEDGWVISLEPEPDNYALLCANIWDHRCTNVEPLCAAAASTSRPAVLALSETNCGDHRAYHRPDLQYVRVTGVRVDDVVRPDARVDVIKIDIQGTDHRAVLGMERTLERCHPTLLVEFWPSGIAEAGDRPVDVLSYYHSLGFKIQILEQPGVVYAPDRFQELVRIVEQSELTFATLLLRLGM